MTREEYESRLRELVAERSKGLQQALIDHNKRVGERAKMYRELNLAARKGVSTDYLWPDDPSLQYSAAKGEVERKFRDDAAALRREYGNGGS